MPSPWALAIDFGTTATAAATACEGQIQLVRIDGDDRMPSMLFWRKGEDGDGELLLGAVADRWAALDPEAVERAPKRRIGDEVLRLGGAEIRVTDAISKILAKVRDEAVRERGGAPSVLYLTHPARWAEDGPELAQLREAALLAGLPPPTFMPEPVAAAIHFATAELGVGEYVAVYDFGGGTFDTAVLQRAANGFEVTGEPGGDEDLGGQDFDDRLYRFLGAQLTEEQWHSLRTARTGGWSQANRELVREARRAKEHLSQDSNAPVYVPAPVNRDILVTTEQLRGLIAEDVEATVVELERTIAVARVHPADLSAIYLAGGSSAIPLVASLISEQFGMVPKTLDDPKTVVARGAAAAAMRRLVAPRRKEPEPELQPQGTTQADRAMAAQVREPGRIEQRQPPAGAGLQRVEPAIKGFASWSADGVRTHMQRLTSAETTGQQKAVAVGIVGALIALVAIVGLILLVFIIPLALVIAFARYHARHQAGEATTPTPQASEHTIWAAPKRPVDPGSRSDETDRFADDVTRPADDLTPPADDLTPPADDLAADDITRPADNLNPPADDLTPPADDLTRPAPGPQSRR